jgi:hypothetical protein
MNIIRREMRAAERAGLSTIRLLDMTALDGRFFDLLNLNRLGESTLSHFRPGLRNSL